MMEVSAPSMPGIKEEARERFPPEENLAIFPGWI
jgi:hypothetical protein